MRQRDIKNRPSKPTIEQKAAKTINFDMLVLQKLEQRSKEEGVSVSQLVNSLCRSRVMRDPDFYGEMAKQHYLEFQRYLYLKKEGVDAMEVIQ